MRSVIQLISTSTLRDVRQILIIITSWILLTGLQKLSMEVYSRICVYTESANLKLFQNYFHASRFVRAKSRLFSFWRLVFSTSTQLIDRNMRAIDFKTEINEIPIILQWMKISRDTRIDDGTITISKLYNRWHVLSKR